MSKIKGAFKSEKGSKVDSGFHDSGSFDPYAPGKLLLFDFNVSFIYYFYVLVNLGQGHDEDDEPLPQEPAQIEEEE